MYTPPRITSCTLFRYSPFTVTTSPERTSAGAKESTSMGSVNSRSAKDSRTVPSLVTMDTLPTTGPSSGTMTRSSPWSPDLVTLKSVTVTPPAKRTSETFSRFVPRMRSSPPRITGFGATALSATAPAYWSVSYSSCLQPVRETAERQRAAMAAYFNTFFIISISSHYL